MVRIGNFFSLDSFFRALIIESIGPLSPAAWVWTKATNPFSAAAAILTEERAPASVAAPNDACRNDRRDTPPVGRSTSIFFFMTSSLSAALARRTHENLYRIVISFSPNNRRWQRRR